MKKRHMMLWTIFLALVLLPSMAFSWGSATHAYIDDQLNKTKSTKNLNEIYGGMAPDIFNYMFESPYLQDFYIATHYDFVKIWNVSKNSLDKSLAYGFISHNDMWGADYTAHHSGITYGQTKGILHIEANIRTSP
jgi:hypothetical protein